LVLATNKVAGTEEEEGFEEAKPYLEKIAFAAIGAGSSGELATSKLILGFKK
jgi:hypothetical protein